MRKRRTNWEERRGEEGGVKTRKEKRGNREEGIENIEEGKQ